MSVYDVNGFVVRVEGSADEVFSEDYGYFKISRVPQKIDLFVKVNEARQFLPTRAHGSPDGMYIPFSEKESTLWYDEGMERRRPPEYFLEGIEFLMWWPDRAWLHAGAVAKDSEAYVFTGAAGVGKTSCILSLLQEGYDYLSDDWLTIGGDIVFPLPKRIRVFGNRLKHKEIAERVLGRKRYYYIPMCELLEYGSKSLPHGYARSIFAGLRERTILRIGIERVFPEVKVASPTPVSKVFLLERNKVDRIEVKRDMPSWELAQKMAYYNAYSWDRWFREYYSYAHRFGIRNKRIEYRLYRDIRIMNEAFGKCDLCRVIVPEGLDLSEVNLTSVLGINC